MHSYSLLDSSNKNMIFFLRRVLDEEAWSLCCALAMTATHLVRNREEWLEVTWPLQVRPEVQTPQEEHRAGPWCAEHSPISIHLGLPKSKVALFEPSGDFSSRSLTDPYLGLGKLLSPMLSGEKSGFSFSCRVTEVIFFFQFSVSSKLGSICVGWGSEQSFPIHFLCSSQDFIELCCLFSWLKSSGMFRCFPYGRHFAFLITLTALVLPFLK